MKLSLRIKLIISYVLIALFCVSAILVIINFMLHREFQKYVTENQEHSNQEIVSLITDSFQEDGTAPSLEVIKKIGQISLDKGMVLQIMTHDDSLNWCMHCEELDQCTAMLELMETNTNGFFANRNGHKIINSYEIIKDGTSYGTVSLEYYGPFYYNNSDVKFLNIINLIFAVGMVLSIVVAVLVGLIMANKIAIPIQRIAKKTEEIEKGHYDSKVEISSSTLEVDHLIHSVNNLAFALGRQKRMRKRLVNDYAHELRTPLAVLQTNLEAMIDGIWEPDKERLNSCNEEILRLTRMLSNIDRLAEIEDETMVLEKVEFSLLALVKEVGSCYEAKLIENKHKFHIEGSDIMMNADRDKMEQVLMNVISNAIKYTNEAGRIEINLSKDKKYNIISVRDNGVGIEEKELPYIFDYLYRVDKSRNSKIPGSGIGLSIVHAIVDAHGGYIRVASKLGEGSILKIYIPR